MKRIIILVTAIVVIAAAFFFYYDSHDKISAEDVSAITLRTATGSIELNKAVYQQYVDLYNSAKWQNMTDDKVTSDENGLTVDILNTDDTHKEFFIAVNGDELFLVTEAKIGYFEDTPDRDLLFDETILTGLEKPFAAPQLTVNSESKSYQLAAISSLWQYQDIYGVIAEQANEYYNEVSTGEFVFTEPESTIEFKLDADFQVDTIEVTANQTAVTVQEISDQNYQIAILPEMGEIDYQIKVTTEAIPLGIYNSTAQFVYDLPVVQNFTPRASVLQDEQVVGGFFLIKGKYFNENTEMLVEQSIIDTPILPYAVGNDVLAVIPLDYYAKTGEHEVVLYAVEEGEKTELARQKLTVLERDYEMQDLTISSSTEQTARTAEAYQEYRSDFKPVRQISEPYQMWQGQFIMPIEGRLTTDYGAKRKVNNELTRYRHDGIDLAAPSGTEIMASNSGKVAFSQRLILTGNSIIIDHGLGFFTYYLHMDERRVEVGEMVEKGQIIGTVGTTGFSTGPHLHFTASYHLNNINPYTLLDWSGEWRNEASEDEEE